MGASAQDREWTQLPDDGLDVKAGRTGEHRSGTGWSTAKDMMFYFCCM